MRVHICAHSPKAGCSPSPPPTQSRSPASCFPGAPSRAFTSPFSASAPPSLFTQCEGPSVPSSQAVSPLPKPQPLPSSLQLSQPSQPPLPLLCPARPGKPSLDRPPAREALLMPPTCPPRHCLSSTAHVSPTPSHFLPRPSPQQRGVCQSSASAFPTRTRASGKQALVCLSILSLSRRAPDT